MMREKLNDCGARCPWHAAVYNFSLLWKDEVMEAYVDSYWWVFRALHTEADMDIMVMDMVLTAQIFYIAIYAGGFLEQHG